MSAVTIAGPIARFEERADLFEHAEE